MRWLESSLLLVIPLVLAASWSLWYVAFSRLWRRQPMLAPADRRPVPWGGLDVAASLAIMILAMLASFTVLAWITGSTPPISAESTPNELASQLVASAAASLATMGTVVVFLKVRTRATWQDLGFSSSRAAYDLLLGIAAYVMLAPIVYFIMLILVQWFPSEHPLVKIVKENPSFRFFALSLFSAVFVAPIVEEFLFRVVLQGWLEAVAPRMSSIRSLRDFRQLFVESVTGVEQHPVSPSSLSLPQADPLTPLKSPPDDGNPYAPPHAPPEPPVEAQVSEECAPVRSPPSWPVLVSSGIFALLHWGHGPDPIPLFVLALGLGYLYRQTHRILPGIVVHMALNGVSMLMLIWSVARG